MIHMLITIESVKFLEIEVLQCFEIHEDQVSWKSLRFCVRSLVQAASAYCSFSALKSRSNDSRTNRMLGAMNGFFDSRTKLSKHSLSIQISASV